ncbi:hypothetical protein ACEPPN_018894 [Leptodophora sp. 'Broadleaf-Isolate-01']
MAQGLENERCPAPIHLLLTRDENFPRSIQLSIQDAPQAQVSDSDVHTPQDTIELKMKKRRLSIESLETPGLSNKRPCLTEAGLDTSNDTSSKSSLDNNRLDAHSTWQGLSSFEVDSSTAESALDRSSSHQLSRLRPPHGPRLLFAVRLEENIRGEDLSIDFFSDWLRLIPAIAREVKVEAAFECNSTLVLVSLPLCLRSYLQNHPAVLSLGPINSTNMITEGYIRTTRAITHGISTRSAKVVKTENGEVGGCVRDRSGSPDSAFVFTPTSCVSLQSDVMNYIYENGRRYHAFKAGRYMFPNDEA